MKKKKNGLQFSYYKLTFNTILFYNFIACIYYKIKLNILFRCQLIYYLLLKQQRDDDDDDFVDEERGKFNTQTSSI